MLRSIDAFGHAYGLTVSSRKSDAGGSPLYYATSCGGALTFVLIVTVLTQAGMLIRQVVENEAAVYQVLPVPFDPSVVKEVSFAEARLMPVLFLKDLATLGGISAANSKVSRFLDMKTQVKDSK